MQMKRLLIQLPAPLKERLVAKRKEGTTASGFIRFLLEREFNQPSAKAPKKGA
jgi:hypothetical protein